MRLSDPETSILAIDRENEYLNSMAAALSGAGAPVAQYVPGAGVLVVEWIVGRTFTEADVRNPDNLLGERQPSQIDAVARSAENLIFFECKFTEQSAGACTQPNLRRGVRQCNNNYELQTNPINNKTARCALTAKGIRYWEHIPEIFTFGADQDHTPCPFAGSWYQWMRNLVQCSAVARHYNLRPAFVVVYADGLFAVAKEIRLPAWQRFLSTLRPRHLPLATLSYQELVALAKQNSAPQQMATWQALDEWVNRKIKSVIGSTPV